MMMVMKSTADAPAPIQIIRYFFGNFSVSLRESSSSPDRPFTAGIVFCNRLLRNSHETPHQKYSMCRIYYYADILLHTMPLNEIADSWSFTFCISKVGVVVGKFSIFQV